MLADAILAELTLAVIRVLTLATLVLLLADVAADDLCETWFRVCVVCSLAADAVTLLLTAVAVAKLLPIAVAKLLLTIAVAKLLLLPLVVGATKPNLAF